MLVNYVFLWNLKKKTIWTIFLFFLCCFWVQRLCFLMFWIMNQNGFDSFGCVFGLMLQLTNMFRRSLVYVCFFFFAKKVWIFQYLDSWTKWVRLIWVYFRFFKMNLVWLVMTRGTFKATPFFLVQSVLVLNVLVHYLQWFFFFINLGVFLLIEMNFGLANYT